jgi:hypothetical protein
MAERKRCNASKAATRATFNCCTSVRTASSMTVNKHVAACEWALPSRERKHQIKHGVTQSKYRNY